MAQQVISDRNRKLIWDDFFVNQLFSCTHSVGFIVSMVRLLISCRNLAKTMLFWTIHLAIERIGGVIRTMGGWQTSNEPSKHLCTLYML